jgi:hypothetical protein
MTMRRRKRRNQAWEAQFLPLPLLLPLLRSAALDSSSSSSVTVCVAV